MHVGGVIEVAVGQRCTGRMSTMAIAIAAMTVAMVEQSREWEKDEDKE